MRLSKRDFYLSKRAADNMDLTQILPKQIFGGMGGAGAAIPWTILQYTPKSIAAYLNTTQPSNSPITETRKIFFKTELYQNAFIVVISWPPKYKIDTNLEVKYKIEDNDEDYSDFLEEYQDEVLYVSQTVTKEELMALKDEIAYILGQLNHQLNQELEEFQPPSVVERIFPRSLFSGWDFLELHEDEGFTTIHAEAFFNSIKSIDVSLVIQEKLNDEIGFYIHHKNDSVEYDISLDDENKLNELKQWIKEIGEENQRSKVAPITHLSKRAQQDVNLFQIFPKDKFPNWIESRISKPDNLYRQLPLPPGINDAGFRAELIPDPTKDIHDYDIFQEGMYEEEYQEAMNTFKPPKTHAEVSLYYDPTISSYEEKDFIKITKPEENWESKWKEFKEIVTIEELPALANKIMPLIEHLSEIYYTMQDKFEESLPVDSPYRILPPQIFPGWKTHITPNEKMLVAGMETKKRFQIIQTRLTIENDQATLELLWPEEFLHRAGLKQTKITAPINNIPNLQRIVDTIKFIGQQKLKGNI